jgi:hypothetical protein
LLTLWLAGRVRLAGTVQASRRETTALRGIEFQSCQVNESA